MEGQLMKEMPAVTIIIPCYNYGCYIGDALNSLLRQHLTDWECFVIDDGSTDDTKEMVAAYLSDPRIHYVYQDNQGQAIARNTGLKLANGRYIQFLDSDDLLQNDKLQCQVRHMDLRPEIDIAYGEVRYFIGSFEGELLVNRWDAPETEWMPKISGKGLAVIRELTKQNIFELGTALFRHSSIQPAGFFNQEFHGVEDYDFVFRLAIAGLQFSFIAQTETFCLMRHHQNSFSKNLSNMYRKELMLRKRMALMLTQSGFQELRTLNKLNYNRRIRRLQNLLIDLAIQKGPSSVNFEVMEWMFQMSNPKQMIYFFPRIFKAFLVRELSRKPAAHRQFNSPDKF